MRKWLLRSMPVAAAVAAVFAAASGLIVELPTLGVIGPGLGGAGGRGRVAAPAPGQIDVPATPSVNVLIALDTSTVIVNANAYNGDQGDPLDSVHVQLSSAQAFTDTLIDSLTATASQRADTLASNADLTEDSTYWVRWRDHGVAGGWSAWSTPASYINDTKPAQITTLSVVAQTDSSLTVELRTVEDGQGNLASVVFRYLDITSENYVWWHASAVEVFDTLGVAAGDTVQRVFAGLTAGTEYEIGALAYRGEPGVDAVYGSPVPTSGVNTATGTTTGTVQDTTDTPTLTLTATADTSSIQMNGSGFVGGSQTHDSTEWRLDNDSDMSSPFYTETSASDLTSHLATDNANLTAGATVYGDVRYFGSGDTSARSAIRSVVNSAPGLGCSNEPSGMTTITDRPFTESPLPASGEAWSPLEFDGSHESIVTSGYSGTAPRSPPSVMRFRYPTSMTGGTGGLNQGVLNFGGSRGTVYYCAHWQMGTDFEVHGSGTTKQGYFRVHNPGVGSGDRSFWNITYGPSMDFQVQNGSECGAHPTGYAHLSGNTANSTSLSVSTWYEIEILLTENTPGSCDGTLDIWVDGLKTHDYDNVGPSNSGDGQGFRRWNQDAIWGGTGGNPSVTFFTYWDHQYVSVKN